MRTPLSASLSRHLNPLRHHAIRVRAREWERGALLSSPEYGPLSPHRTPSHEKSESWNLRYSLVFFSNNRVFFVQIFTHWKVMSVTGIQEEVEYASCDCCGLTEECTPAYISLVRSRYVLWFVFHSNFRGPNINSSIFQVSISKRAYNFSQVQRTVDLWAVWRGGGGGDYTVSWAGNIVWTGAGASRQLLSCRSFPSSRSPDQRCQEYT